MQLKENNSPNIQNHQTHLQQMSQQMQEKDLTNHTNPASTYQSPKLLNQIKFGKDSLVVSP
jgi:hypothetical protein